MFLAHACWTEHEHSEFKTQFWGLRGKKIKIKKSQLLLSSPNPLHTHTDTFISGYLSPIPLGLGYVDFI